MARNPIIGDCALCLAFNVPLARSHIIPEFKFKEAYDEKHQLHTMSYYQPEKGTPMQKGWREPLLCFECEKVIRVWEDYAARLFRRVSKKLVGLEKAFPNRPPPGFAQLPEADFTMYRLFGLSVLWRMSASKLSHFKLVGLGKHHDTIRKALLENDPIIGHYPFMVSALTIQGRFFPDFVTTPHAGRNRCHHIYSWVMGGYHFGFNVSSHRADPVLEELGKPVENGRVCIPIVEASVFPYLREYLADMGEIERGERPFLPRNPEK